MKGYRTIAFNTLSVVTIVAGALLVYVDRLDIEPTLAAQIGLGATVINGLANLALRYVTTTPVGRKT